MISFIVPAHNEEAKLGGTLQAISNAARVVGQPYEIIVVDDASTDATAQIARQHNAAVVSVHHRQIAATRNSGARAAKGNRLFFVDADTTINPRAVSAALRYLDQGAVGGGAPTLFDGFVPLYIQLIAFLNVLGARLIGFTGGAFMYCTSAAFKATGGFDERLFWSEEGAWALALKREGRFVVLWQPVLTSGRRFRAISGSQVIATLIRLALSPSKTFTERASVEKIWYDSNRSNDERIPTSLSARLSNGIALVILLTLLTGPLWYFIPRSWTPLNSAFGKFRFGDGLFLCHAGLFFWPVSFVLLRLLFQRRHRLEWIKLAALCAFCLWQAWESTKGVVSYWSWFYHYFAPGLTAILG